jgi:phosphatidylserine/phosphatidylglycerophosphate/cardiolipin synthase-like enzyme
MKKQYFTVLIMSFMFFVHSVAVAAPIHHAKHVSLNWTFDGDTQQQMLVQAIQSATTSLEVAIFSLTDPSIVFSLKDAQKRGVHIRIITDRMQAFTRTQNVALHILNKSNVPILINTHDGLMHLKMVIVDRSYVITGSYNFSKSANKVNDELLMAIKSPRFLNDCLNEFGIMWNDSSRFEPFK